MNLHIRCLVSVLFVTLCNVAIQNRSESSRSAPNIKEISENVPTVCVERLSPEIIEQFKVPETPIDPEEFEPQKRPLRPRNTFHSSVNDTPRTPEKSGGKSLSQVRGSLKMRNTIHPIPSSHTPAQPHSPSKSLRFVKTSDPDKPSGRIRGPLRVKNTMVPPPASPPHSTSIPIKSADVSSAPKSTRRVTLRTRNTVMTAPSASLHERIRTPRTCKEAAMAKIIQCYAELSLSPKSKRVTQLPTRTPVARRHTEKAPPAPSKSRRRSPAKSRRDSSSECSFTPSEDEDESTSEDTELEDVISGEELSESSDGGSDSSDVVLSRRRRNRRQITRKVPQTPVASQAFIPRRTTATEINRDTLNAKLHASRVSSDCLPCREQEFDTVFEFLFEHLQNRTGGLHTHLSFRCMYISGVPGTGKTATVNAAAKSMAGCVDEDGDDVIPPFDFVTVNGMQVSEPRQVYVHIYEALKKKKVSAHKALSLLEAEFCSSSRYRNANAAPACVLLLDELDLLCSKRQDVLYALFDWACRDGGKKKGDRRPLIILAVANTMDLPERVLHHRVASRLGLNRLAFAPYSHDQLATIVNARLGPELSSSFDAKAIELATRKVAAVSGDARRALDICRRAAETAQLEGGRTFTTTIQHVNAALREMFTSPVLTALRCVSHYERLLLRAIVSEVSARGVEEVILYRCLQQLYALCNLEGVPKPSDTEVFAMCASLGAYKLIMTEPSRRDTNMLLRLNCSQSDVLFALKAAAN
ncbi:unnamed protein product [Hymenolepis diminuta]|uniref:Origin recognition complex subunit 1 n=1 Tax=Hymenolepis diminuta TaxID=6216 RepID=A0A3P6VQH5_HYMDI|nr:unnamed protein product [Hymenolepis diminuta]